MKIENLIDVLTKIKKEIDVPQTILNDAGICKIARHVLIVNNYTPSEIAYFDKFLHKNKPSTHKRNKYREFTQNPYWNDDLFWWKVMLYFPETRKIRMAYIDKVIKNLKSK